MRYTKKVLKKEDGVCPSGGIGRRTGLKILRDLTLVPVQVRPWAPFMIFIVFKMLYLDISYCKNYCGLYMSQYIGSNFFMHYKSKTANFLINNLYKSFTYYFNILNIKT